MSELDDAVNRQPHPMTDNSRAKAELAALRAESSSWRTFAARLAEHLHGWDKSFPVPSEPDEQASYRGSLLARADVVCAQHARMRHALGRLRAANMRLQHWADLAIKDIQQRAANPSPELAAQVKRAEADLAAGRFVDLSEWKAETERLREKAVIAGEIGAENFRMRLSVKAERLRELAREALRQDACVTSGAWTACPNSNDHGKPDGWEIHTELPAWQGFYDLSVLREEEAKLIASARSREPVLARAVLALLARLRHTDLCYSLTPVNIYEDPPRYLPCSCGLDAALEEIR